MLVLSRKLGEEVQIGENITVTVVAISGGKVRLGIAAPKESSITRPDVVEKNDESVRHDA